MKSMPTGGETGRQSSVAGGCSMLKSVAIALFSLLFGPSRIALSCNQMYAIARFMLVEMLVTHA